jgi:hypothetical protein
VPQGSVLGPLLFNIYINDFPLEISKISEVIMFADDTSILCTSKDYNNLKIKLSHICRHMSRWFQANLLALNLDKTQMIKFTPTILIDYSLKTLLLNSILKTAESTFLGLQMDNHLTCKAHVNQLLHKLSMVGFQMRKLSYVLSINNLKSVYYAYYHTNKIWAKILIVIRFLF